MSSRTKATGSQNARRVLAYEANWEDGLTSLGPGPSHWLFTGGVPLDHQSAKMVQQPMDAFAESHDGASSPGHDTPDATEPLPWIPDNNDRPALSRELLEASMSVDSLETCPSLRASPSQLSLASWTSFDALDRDPFRADITVDRHVLIAFPDDLGDDAASCTASQFLYKRLQGETTGLKQLSRHHFVLHQHQQLAGQNILRRPPSFVKPAAASAPRASKTCSPQQLRPAIRPRHPLLALPKATTSDPVSDDATSSGVLVTATIVPRPHVATQPATLATSPAASSMRSFLAAAGDACSSAAVRSLRRVLKLETQVASPSPSSKSQSTARKPRTTLPHDWVMV